MPSATSDDCPEEPDTIPWTEEEFAELTEQLKKNPNPEFSPAFPAGELPQPTPAERVQVLRTLLNDEKEAAFHTNIRTIISLYEQNKIKNGDVVWVQDGKVFDKRPEGTNGGPILVERPGNILEAYSYSWAPQNVPFQPHDLHPQPHFMQHSQPLSAQRSRGARWFKSLEGSHRIPMLFRLPTALGGDDNRHHYATTIFDTGSTCQTIFDTDLQALGYDESTYQGLGEYGRFNTMAGDIITKLVELEICLLSDEFSEIGERRPLTCWFRVRASNHTKNAGRPRLSGTEMYKHVWFGLTPNNTNLLAAGLSRTALSMRLNTR
ncbi:hypothetical protein F5X98DRAFT_324876 [Xylaria grammica]|nr:hypothetical protein F5X98DRAFT_324876 [Xylaria grammica]